jgi:hypothetical protein
MIDLSDLRRRYRRRLNRKRLLWRAFRKRRELMIVSDRLADISANAILGVSVMRNEQLRLPFYLDHYRRLGVGHFLIVDNASSDGTGEFLAKQRDVTLWRTAASYRESRFGMDWLNWLLRRHAQGRWAVTADADELLIYPDWEARDLRQLTGWLDRRGVESMGAMMLDLYPKGRLGTLPCRPGQDPTEVACWFDSHGYWAQRKPNFQNVCLKGGVRARHFFPDDPEKAPFLNKIPLVRWRASTAYVNSTHMLLPVGLNRLHGTAGPDRPSGLLLHTKFLSDASTRADIEKHRREHFTYAGDYDAYYDAVIEDPVLWTPDSTRYDDWRQLVDLGLMERGRW